MNLLYNFFEATVAPTATAAAKEINEVSDIDPKLLVLAVIAFLAIMASPLIQINLSASKNKFLWVIPPIFTLVLFTAIAIFALENIVAQIFLSVSVPIVLIIIHIATKKNLIN